MFKDFARGKYYGVMITSRLGRDIYFTGKSADFINKNFNSELENVKPEFNVKNVVVLNQVHGTDIVAINKDVLFDSLQNSSGEGCFCADGFIFKFTPEENKTADSLNILFGIRTADCLPVYIETREKIILLHAGWRGVAGGIISKALMMLDKQEVYSFIIGPAAGSSAYEVGREVIGQFDSKIVQASAHGDKYLLDLKATAVKVFEQDYVKKSSDCLVEVSKICTICDVNWHSHRREGSLRGSNLMFIRMSF